MLGIGYVSNVEMFSSLASTLRSELDDKDDGAPLIRWQLFFRRGSIRSKDDEMWTLIRSIKCLAFDVVEDVSRCQMDQ